MKKTLKKIDMITSIIYHAIGFTFCAILILVGDTITKYRFIGLLAFGLLFIEAYVKNIYRKMLDENIKE